MDIEENNGISKAEEDRSRTSRSEKEHCEHGNTVERTTRGRASPRTTRHQQQRVLPGPKGDHDEYR